MKKAFMLMAGFALMSGVATASAQTIYKSAHASGYIGIRYDDETINAGGKSTSRVVIKDVSEGSPADKAGLRKGDQILRINGLAATNGKFAAIARTLSAGDTVRLRVKRDDKERDHTIVAAERPSQFVHAGPDRTIIISADSVRELTKEWLEHARIHIDSMRLPRIFVQPGDSSFNIRIEKFRNFPGDTIIFNRDTAFIRKWREGMPTPRVFEHFEEGPGPIIRSFEIGSRAIAGAEMTEFDPAMKSYFGTDHGLLVVRVAPETPAAKAGLQPGDVVVKANDRPINKISDLRDLMWTQSQQTLKLEIIRKGDSRTLEVPLRKRSED